MLKIGKRKYIKLRQHLLSSNIELLCNYFTSMTQDTPVAMDMEIPMGIPILVSRGRKPGPSPKPDQARASVCWAGSDSGLVGLGRPCDLSFS